jgi:hypothetical protein
VYESTTKREEKKLKTLSSADKNNAKNKTKV